MAQDRTEALNYALATWVFLLHVDGIEASDAAVAEGCASVSAAVDEVAGNAAGEALVKRVAAMVDGDGADHVASFARKLYGEQVDTALGEGDRDTRLQRVRKYQFATNRPWLARIYDRDTEGEVGPTWLVVERVTDEVTAMDPNPWNDIDETRRIPVDDFQVLWELDACTAVAV